MQLLQRIWRDSEGATAIEYGLIVALIAVAIIGALTSTGNELSATMTAAKNGMAS